MRKKIIILSMVLLGLLGAIEIYVQSDAFAIRIRPYVAGPLKAALGEGAEIGRVKANFIPLYLEVRDISIPDDEGKQIVAVRKVRVYINPLPLLLKKIRLFSISILEPRIYVKRRSDGVVNLMPFVERIKSNMGRFPQEGQSRFDLLLRTITIRNGQIEFTDRATSAELSITSIDMTIRIDLSQERVRTVIRDARLRAFAPGYPELVGNLKTTLEYNRGKLHMESAELSTADAKLTVSGDVGPQPDAALDLRLSFKSGPKTIRKFTDILKPGQKKEVTRMEAAAVIRGKASDPAVEGNIRISDLLFREILLKDAALSFTYRNRTAEIRGKKWKVAQGDKSIVIDSIDANMGYDKGEMDIRRFEILAGDLAFRLKGTANPSRGFDANLSAESSGKGQTLSFFTSVPVEGAVSVSGRLAGALTSPQFDGIITAGPATVRGILFSDIRGALSYKDERIKVSSVNIREQSSRYVLDGSVVFLEKEEPVYAARLKVVRSDVVNIVALFYEQLPLRIAAEGELSFEGTARNYSGSGFLRLESGSAYGETFSRGVVSAKLSTGRIAFPQIELFKEQGVVKTSGWIGFDGTYEADLEGRNLDLAAVDHVAGMSLGGKFNIKLHSSGSFSHPYVNASLDVDELLFRTAPVGGMNADAEIKDGLFTVNAGLSDKRTRLAVRWNLHKPYIWNAEAQVKSDTIDPLLVLGNKDLAGSVKVIADGTLTAHGKGLDMSSFAGETVFQKLSMTLGDFRMENEGEASLSVVGGRLKVKTLNFVGPGTKLGITGGAKYPSEIDLTLKGTADLSLLKLLYREVEHTGGTADVQLTIKDEWKNPDVAGELSIRNGDIKLKDVPQRFSALNGRMVFSQGRIVGDSISAEMGGGTLKASGWAQLSGVSLRNFSVQAAADNVTVRYPAGLVSTLYGELHYDGDASEQSLSGDITIKRARYDKPIEWKTMLVDVGKGLYQKKKTDVMWIGDTQINVRFHGTNDILFQNNFATMPLDVDIFLRGTVNHPQLLGRIEARKGVVYFRKNDFKILHISADFVDPGRMNPVLDIQAETRVREYEIWLSVTGTADRAVVTLMSEPTLNETDILSLLALGKKGSELKGKETGVGVSEAASLATGQFQDIFERRARSLTGLDRFQVDPYVGRSDTSVPRVTVGKELVQSKLFVTYSSNVGASVPEQIFRIEYLLNRHFSLVGESNDLGNTGADIKYRFEFK